MSSGIGNGSVVFTIRLRGRIQRNRVVSLAGNPMGTASPWHTILLARSSVLYLTRQGGGKIGVSPCWTHRFCRRSTGEFCGRFARENRIFAELNPLVRRRQEELFRSAAEKKVILPLPGKVYKKLSSPRRAKQRCTILSSRVEQEEPDSALFIASSRAGRRRC